MGKAAEVLEAVSEEKKEKADVLVAVAEEEKEQKAADDILVDEAEEEKKEAAKPKHFANGSITDWLWKHGDLNPDYRLAVLNAANEGFQSKMNADVGSYVIYGFWRRATALLKEKGEVPRLGKIFSEIQKDLGEWKQLPVFEWNHDTANVVLKRRKWAQKPIAKVEAGAGKAVFMGAVEMAEIVLESGDVHIIEEQAIDDTELVFAEQAMPNVQMV